MTLRKRSLSIAGHATSISLEDPFWEALRDIAAARGQTVADVVTAVDLDRTAGAGPEGPAGNLSSALRVYVLAYYREAAGAPR
jgi:predicted DNA-binding ribbon-helix-helix protein